MACRRKRSRTVISVARVRRRLNPVELGLGFGAAIAAGVVTLRGTQDAALLVSLLLVPVALVVPLRWLLSGALWSIALIPYHYIELPSLAHTLTPAAALMLIWALRILAERGPEWRFGANAFLGCVLVGAVAGSFMAHPSSHDAAWLVDFVLLVLLPAWLAAGAGQVSSDDFLRPWRLVAPFVGAYAAVEAFFLHRNPLWDWAITKSTTVAPVLQVWSTYRATSTLGHPLMVGVFLSVGTVLCLGRAIIVRTPSAWLAVGLSGAGLLASGDRGSVVALLVGLIFLAAGFGIRREEGNLRRVGVVVLVLALLVGGALSSAAGERATSAEGVNSANTRVTRLEAGLTVVEQSPLTGSGPGSAGFVASQVLTPSDAVFEDAWLEFFVACGLVAGVALIFTVWRAIARATIRSPTAAAGLAVYAVASAGFNLWEGQREALIFFGFALAGALAAGKSTGAVAREVGD
jgi:hypothetical protein